MHKTGAVTSAYYRDGKALRAKHRLSGDLQADFVEWVLGLIDLSTARSVLDVGCGWGRFLWPVAHRLRGWVVIGTDRSVGMLRTATESGGGLPVTGLVGAAAALLPFPDARFELVMANHMLYEVPDLDAAVAELARVVAPGGTLIATTNSETVRVPLVEFHQRVLIDLGITGHDEVPSPFSLENGASVLAAHFDQVDTHVFSRQVEVRDAADLARTYATTGRYLAVSDDQRVLPAFTALAEAEIQREGAIRSETRMGAFVTRVGCSP